MGQNAQYFLIPRISIRAYEVRTNESNIDYPR